jgi:hypothetical protein
MKSHPKAGEPTHFVEKIIAGMLQNPAMKNHQSLCGYDNLALMDCHLPKSTTIREGKNWSVGDKFSPRIWSGRPYCSPQKQICDDIEIKRVYDFKYNGFFWINRNILNTTQLITVANNDGLTLEDFWAWFKKSHFEGQLLVWDERIYY